MATIADDPDFVEDGSETDDADFPQGSSSSKLRQQLRQSSRELRRLREDYEAEVQLCADLREQLEARDEEIDQNLAPLQEELAKQRAAIEAAQLAECRAVMNVEDHLGVGNRLLTARNREIQFLEKRLHLITQSCSQILQDDDDLADTPFEEALRSTDKEVSKMQDDVQLREKQISSLSTDLRNILDYMIRMNIDAAGGPGDDLGPDDFLPAAVQEHLGLGEHGKMHLTLLLKKYEMQMQAEAQIVPRARPRKKDDENADVLSQASDKELADRTHEGLMPAPKMRVARSRSSSKMPEFADTNEDKSVATCEASLTAVGMEEEDIFSASWGDDGQADSGSVNVDPADGSAAANVTSTEPPASTFDDEARLMREDLSLEAQHVASVLGIGAEERDESDEVRPLFNMLRAAAEGDDYSVKALSSRFSHAGGDDNEDLLGWTAWHIAAWSGHTSVLECLKEDLVDRGVHHLVALGRPTKMGMPPLGVACLRGQVEAARSLLLGMAPLDVHDVRGNTPLMWAVAGRDAGKLVPLLLAASADPSLKNNSGHVVDVSAYPRSFVIDEACYPSTKSTIPVDDVEDMHERMEYFAEPYHQILAKGGQPQAQTNLLHRTLIFLKAPSRDSASFEKNDKGKALAKLTNDEKRAGVYSDWITNYTHAGLENSVKPGFGLGDPLAAERNRQVLVLTTERVMLFKSPTWELLQVIALSEIQQLLISSYSDTVLIIRMHRNPDILLDMTARGRFMEEIRLATTQVAARWGGTMDFSGVVQVQNEAEPIIPLMDEWRTCVGCAAFLEQDIFLLLPYIPRSVLMRAPETFFFGFLDFYHIQRPRRGAAVAWKWQSYLFVLKSGQGSGRQLHWCRHPNDIDSVGYVAVESIRDIRPLETPQADGYCMILDYESGSGAEAMTLRARSDGNREDWITSIRTMQTWL